MGGTVPEKHLTSFIQEEKIYIRVHDTLIIVLEINKSMRFTRYIIVFINYTYVGTYVFHKNHLSTIIIIFSI